MPFPHLLAEKKENTMLNTPAKQISPACVSARASVLDPDETPVSPANRTHLASCPHCSPLWKQFRRLTKHSKRLPLGPAPDALRGRVLEQIQTRSIPTAFQPDVAEGARTPFPYKPVLAGVGGIGGTGG